MFLFQNCLVGQFCIFYFGIKNDKGFIGSAESKYYGMRAFDRESKPVYVASSA